MFWNEQERLERLELYKIHTKISLEFTDLVLWKHRKAKW